MFDRSKEAVKLLFEEMGQMSRESTETLCVLKELLREYREKGLRDEIEAEKRAEEDRKRSDEEKRLAEEEKREWEQIAGDVLEELLKMRQEYIETLGAVEKVIGDQGWGKIIEAWNRRRERYLELFEARLGRKK